MDKLTYLSNADAGYIDALYQAYKADPEAVDAGWRRFFEGFDLGQQAGEGRSQAQPAAGEATSEHAIKEIRVLNMIHMNIRKPITSNN